MLAFLLAAGSDARLIIAGAQPSVKARNREVLYALSRTFERAAKKKQKAATEPNPAVASKRDETANGRPMSGSLVDGAQSPSSSAQHGTESRPASTAEVKKMKKRKRLLAEQKSMAKADSATPTKASIAVAAAAADPQNASGIEAVGTAAPGQMENGHSASHQIGSKKKRKRSMSAIVAEAVAMRAAGTAGKGIATPSAAAMLTASGAAADNGLTPGSSTAGNRTPAGASGAATSSSQKKKQVWSTCTNKTLCIIAISNLGKGHLIYLQLPDCLQS